MDDDCIPSKTALEDLFNIRSNYLVRNSLVLDTATMKLSFGLYDLMDKIYYSNYNQLCDKSLIYSANFFNGTLLNRKIVEKIGLPLTELFMHGDEYEYFLRLRKNKIIPVTITKSKVYHPKESKIIFKIGNFYFEYRKISSLKKYYYFRNLIWIHKMYSKEMPIRRIIKDFLLDMLFNIIFLNFSSNLLVIRGIKDGILSDHNFDYHTYS